MTKIRLGILLVLECVSLGLIVSLWRRKSRMPAWQRCLWSGVLLVPVLGWLLYGFNSVNPDSHPDDLPERWGGDAPHDS